MVIPDTLQYEYPFQNHYLYLNNGETLHYIDEGQGHPVVMVHGNPTWSFFYRNIVKKLRPHFRCIALDHIGCGQSSKPQNYNYCLGQHIDNLETLLATLDLKKFSLIVHDWGGAIGLGAALRDPKRLEKLVILNTAAFTDPNISKRISICKTSKWGEPFIRRLNGFAWPALYMAVTRPLKKKIKDGYLLPYDNYHNRVAIARFVQDIPMSPEDKSWETLKEIERGLPSIGCSKLILWGEKDFCFNQHFLYRWREIYPEAEVETYPRAGHYLLEDENESTAFKIDQFLSDQRMTTPKGPEVVL